MLPTLTCANVRIGGGDDFTIRNRLWRTTCIPVHKGQGSGYTATHFSDQPGYLLLHDEDDGFRLSWIVDKRLEYGGLKLVSDDIMPNRPSRDDIVTRVVDSSWEKSSKNGVPNVRVALEAYLHVDALLEEIRSKRQEVFNYLYLKCPDFYYRLISVSSCGRVAQLVVVFSNRAQRLHIVKKARRTPTSVGLFLQIDLFTHSYREIEWGQCSYELDPVLLRGWASLLALNRRMKDLRLGPFCLVNPPAWIDCKDWSSFLVEENSEGETSSPTVWNQYLKDMKSTKIKVPSPPMIPYSMLYPDADVMSNEAVRRGYPLSNLKCRTGVELVYS